MRIGPQWRLRKGVEQIHDRERTEGCRYHREKREASTSTDSLSYLDFLTATHPPNSEGRKGRMESWLTDYIGTM